MLHWLLALRDRTGSGRTDTVETIDAQRVSYGRACDLSGHREDTTIPSIWQGHTLTRCVLRCALPSCARSDCKLLKCARCGQRYCSVDCQREHWRDHKRDCVAAK